MSNTSLEAPSPYYLFSPFFLLHSKRNRMPDPLTEVAESSFEDPNIMLVVIPSVSMSPGETTNWTTSH